MFLRKVLIIISAVLCTGCAREVALYTIPSGSIITINNNEYTTPADIKLKDGLYSVKAELKGYESESFSITVDKGNVRFSHYLTPEKVRFNLEITPTDSHVFLGDQKLVNGTNLVIPGSYKLTASKPLYRTVEENVVIDLSTDYSRSIILEQSKKLTVIMDFTDPVLTSTDPEEYSTIEFFNNGKGYILKDIDKLKLELGKRHEIELKESGVTLAKYIIPAEENEIIIELESFNEASFIVDKVLNSEEEIDHKGAFKRLFVLDGIENSISTQYSSYFDYLLNQYDYETLLALIDKGSYYSTDENNIYKPMLQNDDLEIFISVERAVSEKLPGLIDSIIENKAYKCLEYVLGNITEEEINKSIIYESKDDFRGGATYLIFLSQNDPKAFEMFIEHGARTDVKEVMKYYDFDNPGTIIKTTTIEISEGLGKFNETEERKDFK